MSEQVRTSLNKREGSPPTLRCITYNACRLLHRFIFATNHYWRRPLTMFLLFFPYLFMCKYLKYILTISVREGAQWEISKFFFQTSTDADLSCQGCQYRSEKFGRILKYTFTGQLDGGGVQKTRKVNFYSKNKKYILILLSRLLIRGIFDPYVMWPFES